MKIVFCVFALSLACVVKGQQFSQRLFLGLTISQIAGDDVGGYDKFGLMGGAGLTLPLKKEGFDLLFDIYYSQRGSKNDPKSFNTWKIKLNYLEFSPTLRFTIKEKFKPRLGVSVGYALKRAVGDGLFLDASESYYRMDWNIAGGLDYALSEDLYVGARVQYSALSVHKSLLQYNNSIYVVLGVKL